MATDREDEMGNVPRVILGGEYEGTEVFQDGKKQPIMVIPDQPTTFAWVGGKLEAMYDAQHQLQVRAYGKDPTKLEGEEQIQFIKDMTLALTDELHEFLAETGWKPWATSRHVHTDLAKGELVDAFHFFMNLMLVIGMTPDDLFNGYMEKRGRNARRQAEGYDGVAGKCSSCGRAIDDIAAKQGVPVEEIFRFISGRVFCQLCLDEAEANDFEGDDE